MLERVFWVVVVTQSSRPYLVWERREEAKRSMKLKICIQCYRRFLVFYNVGTLHVVGVALSRRTSVFCKRNHAGPTADVVPARGACAGGCGAVDAKPDAHSSLR